MPCTLEERSKLIDDYIDNKLSSEETRKFEQHVLECDECHGELAMTLELKEMLQAKGEALFPELVKEIERDLHAFKKKPQRRTTNRLRLGFDFLSRYKMITAVSMAAATVLLFLVFRHPAGTFDPRKFQEAPFLEELVQDSTTRFDVRVLSPNNGFNATDAITFRWETEYDGELFIKILDNEENPVLSLSTKSDSLKIASIRQKLPPGIYYWKLESSRSLLFVGKFFVDKP